MPYTISTLGPKESWVLGLMPVAVDLCRGKGLEAGLRQLGIWILGITYPPFQTFSEGCPPKRLDDESNKALQDPDTKINQRLLLTVGWTARWE